MSLNKDGTTYEVADPEPLERIIEFARKLLQVGRHFRNSHFDMSKYSLRKITPGLRINPLRDKYKIYVKNICTRRRAS